MGTSKEREQQDVHVFKRENHSKPPKQESGSKGDQGLVWQTNGPGQVQQRHQPERGHWEPRIHSDTKSPFCPDGTILPCLEKSKLIHLLNKLATAENRQEDQQPEDGIDTTPVAISRKIALVDGMILLQKMSNKPATIVTIKHASMTG